MGTTPVSLDRPPAQPPVAGASAPLSGVSSMFQRKMDQQQAGAPQGGASDTSAVMVEAVSRGLQQLEKDPNWAPYAERATAILEQGKKANASPAGGSAGGPGGAAAPQSGSPSGTPTPDGGSAFPG